jgi:hypothetical protein
MNSIRSLTAGEDGNGRRRVTMEFKAKNRNGDGESDYLM